MQSYTLYINSKPVKTIVADNLKVALAQVPEMTTPERMVSCTGYYQWIGPTPYELIADD